MFPEIYKMDIENEINEVLIFTDSKVKTELPKVKNVGSNLQELIRAASPSSEVDLASFLESLTLFC